MHTALTGAAQALSVAMREYVSLLLGEIDFLDLYAEPGGRSVSQRLLDS